MPDKTALDDDAAADMLHRMVFELSQVTGATTRADTALTCSRAALTLYLAALIKAGEPTEPEPSPQPPRD